MYGKRIAQWLFFGVLLVIAPLSAQLILLKYNFISHIFPQALSRLELFDKMICNGELLLICIPICGAAVGELLYGVSSREWLRITLGGIASLVFFFLSVVYIVSYNQPGTIDPVKLDSTLTFSYVLSICTVIVSLFATLVATENPKSKKRREA